MSKKTGSSKKNTRRNFSMEQEAEELRKKSADMTRTPRRGLRSRVDRQLLDTNGNEIVTPSNATISTTSSNGTNNPKKRKHDDDSDSGYGGNDADLTISKIEKKYLRLRRLRA